MILKENNYAFIDSQNLNLGIQDMVWQLDWKRFRVYLLEKYKISKAYLFLGYIPKNQQLYLRLKTAGFELIFKPVIITKNAEVKGNCDSELVLQSMIDLKNYNEAIIVSGDGDFYCLIKYFYKIDKLKYVMAPNLNKCSALLKQSAREKILYMNNLRGILEYK